MIKSTYSTSLSLHVQEMADARCWRGCEQKCKFLHLWLECPRIEIFWVAIALWIERLTPRPMEFTPLCFLFHGMPGSFKSYRKSITPHLLNAAKLLVPRFWKQATFPTLEDWKKEVNLIMETEVDSRSEGSTRGI